MGRDLVAKLYAMAEQTGSPKEAENAKRVLAKMGHPPVIPDPRKEFTTDEVLSPQDRDALLAWLETRPDA